MTNPFAHEATTLPVQQALLFAPVHKRHFGTAIGCAAALLLGTLTALHVTLYPGESYPLSLLSEYFFGYRVSYGGALIGAAWAFFVGFVGGWFAAFCRNFLLASMVFWVRARANLQTSADFLDHI